MHLLKNCACCSWQNYSEQSKRIDMFISWWINKIQHTHMMESYSATKGIKNGYTVWHGWTLKTCPPGVAILISDKVDFKPTLIKQDKEGHSILIEGEIDQKEIIIINLYAPNVNTPNFIKHTLKDLKAYINTNTVVVGDFNTPLSSIDRSSKQKNQ
jgi:exonuclease III